MARVAKVANGFGMKDNAGIGNAVRAAEVSSLETGAAPRPHRWWIRSEMMTHSVGMRVCGLGAVPGNRIRSLEWTRLI